MASSTVSLHAMAFLLNFKNTLRGIPGVRRIEEALLRELRSKPE
jgi:hypothetical protein